MSSEIIDFFFTEILSSFPFPSRFHSAHPRQQFYALNTARRKCVNYSQRGNDHNEDRRFAFTAKRMQRRGNVYFIYLIGRWIVYFSPRWQPIHWSWHRKRGSKNGQDGLVEWPTKGNVSDTVRNFRRRRGLFEVHRIIYCDVLPPAVVAIRSYSTWWLATRRDGAKLRAVSFASAIALTL